MLLDMLVESHEILAFRALIDQVKDCPEALARVAISANSSFGLLDISLSLEASAQNQRDSCHRAIVEPSHEIWVRDDQNREI